MSQKGILFIAKQVLDIVTEYQSDWIAAVCAVFGSPDTKAGVPGSKTQQGGGLVFDSSALCDPECNLILPESGLQLAWHIMYCWNGKPARYPRPDCRSKEERPHAANQLSMPFVGLEARRASKCRGPSDNGEVLHRGLSMSYVEGYCRSSLFFWVVVKRDLLS